MGNKTLRYAAICMTATLALAGCKGPEDDFKEIVSKEISGWGKLCLGVDYEYDIPTFPMPVSSIESFSAIAWGEGVLRAGHAGDDLAGSLFGGLASIGLSENSNNGLPMVTNVALLEGMFKQGLVSQAELEVKSGWSSRRVDAVELTEKGSKIDFWSEDASEICLGKPVFGEIQRFTYDQNGNNENAATVDFSWTFETPSWIEKNAFEDIPGVQNPSTASIFVVKSSDGWRVVTENDGGA